MRNDPVPRRLSFAFGAVALLFASLIGVIRAQNSARGDEFNDSHFHLTNYIQQGIEPRSSCKIMGNRVADRRCSASRCSSSGRMRTPATSRRPTTSTATRRSTTTRSPTPTSPASTALVEGRAGALRPDDHRLQSR
jgi:hypothetical protein